MLENRKHNVKCTIRHNLIMSVFERLVHTHLPMLNNHVGKSFVVGEAEATSHTHLHSHTWTITRVKDIWTFTCSGFHNWCVSFDTCEVSRDGVPMHTGIDTFVFDPDPLLDTAKHLTMAITLVCDLVVDYNSDGTKIEE